MPVGDDTHTKDPALDKPITIRFLLMFSLPTMVSMLGMGVFGIIDGIFAARYIDAYALSAVGLVTPFIMFAMSLGIMLGTGGNALVAKLVGEGEFKYARRDMTLVSIASFLLSIALSTLGFLFPDLILQILGVDADVYHMAYTYMLAIMPFLPLAGLGMLFQQFMMTEGKAHISMIASLGSGLLGVYLNYLLIYQLHMGLQGAAIATGITYAVPAGTGFLFLLFNRKGTLYFVMPKLRWFVIFQAASNGISEMVGILAFSITGVLMNNILMDLDGAMAVAAVGISGGVGGLIGNLYFGFAAGISPLISYNFGKGDTHNLKKLFSQALTICISLALSASILVFFFAEFFLGIYDIDPLFYAGGFIFNLPVYDLSITAIHLMTFGFVFMAINNFGSIMFTSLNDGVTSAIIAFCGSFLFIMIFVPLFAYLWGVNGVFIATPAANVATFAVTGFLFLKNRKKYHYA